MSSGATPTVDSSSATISPVRSLPAAQWITTPPSGAPAIVVTTRATRRPNRSSIPR